VVVALGDLAGPQDQGVVERVPSPSGIDLSLPSRCANDSAYQVVIRWSCPCAAMEAVGAGGELGEVVGTIPELFTA
jgi:hypothetical protein